MALPLSRTNRFVLRTLSLCLFLAVSCSCRADWSAHLSISPSTVTGGQSTTGTLTISPVAPVGGLTVQLVSSASSYALPPASVTVPQGYATQTFTITTYPWYTATVQAMPVTISAVSPSASAAMTVLSTVGSPPVLSSLTVNPAQVTGGNSSSVTANLSGPAPPGGATVFLSTTTTGVTVDPSVFVPGGSTMSNPGTINTPVVWTETTAPITGTYNNGPPVSANLTIEPPGCNLGVTISLYANPVLNGVADWFTANVTNPNNRQLNYHWDYGDGYTDNSVMGYHGYTQPKLSGGKIVPYHVTLTVTDANNANCSASASTDVTVDAGVGRINRPGFGAGSCQPDPFSGNASILLPDPVATRGYPLANNIYLNTQAVETNRLLGSATFTYDIHIAWETNYEDNGNTHWKVVDGTGRRLDFGYAFNPPYPWEAGIFSSLFHNPNGTFTLSGAGAPGSIGEAGNFTYDFNSNWQLTKITDPAGNTQSLTYSGILPTSLTSVHDDNTNKQITFIPGNGYVTINQNHAGETTTVYLNGSQVSQVVIAGCTSWQFSYYGNGLLQSYTRDNDPHSKITYTYTPFPSAHYLNVATPIMLANQYSEDGRTSYAWGYSPASGADDSVYVTNNKGGTSRYDFKLPAGTIIDADLVKVTLPQLVGATQAPAFTFQYNGQHQVTSASDGLNSITLTYSGGMLGSVNSVGRTWSWTWGGTNNADLLNAADPVSSPLVTLVYDTQLTHVPVSATDKLGHQWQFGLETATVNGQQVKYGQVKTVTAPTGSTLGVLTTAYDETGSTSSTWGYPLSAGIVKNNATTDYVTFDLYDYLGDLTQFTTYPNNTDHTVKNTTQMSYDSLQRLNTLVQPNGKIAYWVYGLYSRFLSYTRDEANTYLYYTFCPVCGALESVSGPMQWSLNWQRDGDEDLCCFTDARGNPTFYRYGSAGEFIGITYPDSSTTSVAYDNYARPRQFINGNGQAFNVNYDGYNRVASVNGLANLTFGYNADDTLQSYTNQVAAVSYLYNLDGTVQQVTYDFSPWGFHLAQTVSYVYNPDGTRQSMTWASSGAPVCTWNYTYDQAGRLASVINSYNETTAWTYDGEGKLASQHNANGTWNNYFYENDAQNNAGSRGWVTSMGSYSTPLNNYFAAYQLTYDQNAQGVAQNTVGNLTSVLDWSGDSVAYSYNALYQLTAEARTSNTTPYSHSYGFDRAGNRTAYDGASYTYDAANKLQTYGSTQASYDGDGELLSISALNIPYKAGLWDDRGDLTVLKNSSGTSVSYQNYDGMGNRVWTQAPGGPSVYLIYDGDTVIGEFTNTGAYTGFVSAVYTWGADGLVSERLVPQNKSLWYHYGPQGETRQLTDSTATVVDTYLYTAWGVPVTTVMGGGGVGAQSVRSRKSAGRAVGGGTDPNPFQFGGKFGYYTLPYGLIQCGARWYDPNQGRWFSRDPIGYDGGDNLYTYAANNPLFWCDPDGTDLQKVKDWYMNGMDGASGWLDRHIGGLASKLGTSYGNWESGRGSWSQVQQDAQALGIRLVEEAVAIEQVAKLPFECAAAASDISASIASTTKVPGGNPAWVTKLAATEEKNILTAIKHIDAKTKPPWKLGKWGTKFKNAGEPLPTGVVYKEYYLPKSNNLTKWGANRLLTGSDGRVYFTWDHYHNFVRVR